MSFLSRTAGPFFLFPAVCAIGVPSVSSAQSSTPSSDTLAEVVVTATKRSENTVDVPIAITALSGDALAAGQIQNVFDLSQVVPGLNYTSGAAARPNLRGVTSLSSAAGAENNIAIYIDGIYQPDIYGNAFDLPDLDSVQVLKGPQGTLFGRNAEGGAIVVTTRNPTFTTTGDIQVSEGTYDGGYKGGTDTRVTTFLSGPVNDKLALSLSALYDTSPGYAHNVLTGGRTGLINAQLYRAKALFKPADNVEFLLITYYGERIDNSVYNLQNLNPIKAVPAIAPSTPYYIANDATGLFQVERYGSTLKGTVNFDAGTFTTLSGVGIVKPQIVADDDATSAHLAVYLLGQPNRTVSQEFDFASRKFGGFSFVSGVFAYNSVEEFTPLAVASSLTGPVLFTDYAKSTDDAWALFGEGNYDVTDRLTLVAGIRYSWEERQYQGSTVDVQPLPMINKADFHAYTPRFSIRYKVADQTNVYFTYSKGFKSGLFDTSSFSPNIIQPETLKAYELGIKSNPSPTFQVSASVYHYDSSNLQVQTNTANGLAELSNAGAAEIDGGEIELSWRALHQITLNGGVSYIPVARYRDYPKAPIVAPDLITGGGYNTTIDGSGLRLAQTPRFQSNAQARYDDDFAFGKLGGEVTFFHSSGFPFELSQFVYQKGYSLVNASVDLHPAFSRNSRFTLWGKNLTNTVYIGNYLTSGTGFDEVYEAPRELGVSFGYSF